MLEKDCNGNAISTFPPCYAFSDDLAPRQIQSISRNVRNRNKSFETIVRRPYTCVQQHQLVLGKYQCLCKTIAICTAAAAGGGDIPMFTAPAGAGAILMQCLQHQLVAPEVIP